MKQRVQRFSPHLFSHTSLKLENDALGLLWFALTVLLVRNSRYILYT